MENNSRTNFLKTINHEQPDGVVVDFGSTVVSGIHVRIVEKLRDYFGLEKRPVKVIDPFQMLGEVDSELVREMDIDVVGLIPEKNLFAMPNKNWKQHQTLWGQEVLVPGDFNHSYNDDGDMLLYAEGDTSYPPSAIMPKAGYFFDAIERQQPIDESKLRVEDNLEEFGHVSVDDLIYFKNKIDFLKDSDKAVMATLGGSGLGDIALVPGMNLKDPKGIRGVAEWYMSTLTRVEFVKELFEKQTDIAIENLKKIFTVVGNDIHSVFVCGTDFGTQKSTFCSPETFYDLYMPYYKKVNGWIHRNTNWKTFKHSCGAVESFIPLLIEAEFDILNPVQINASGMEPRNLKKKYGDQVVFWGGGADTQGVFAHGKPQEVKDQVKEQCEILNKNGGFVFNTVHNIQANVPFENVVAMLEALKEI